MAAAREKLPALLCAEEDPLRCHRHHLVAGAPVERGAAVWRIRRSGELATARFDPENAGSPLDLFAQLTVRGTQI